MERRPDRNEKETRFRGELESLSRRNAGFSAEMEKNREEIEARRARRETIVLSCMDERNGEIEESLGLLPGEAEVYGSAGARLDIATFERLYGGKIEEARRQDREAVVYLTLHECADDAHLGCAAFKNDVPAARAFFAELKGKISANHPEAKVDVVMFDTSSGKIAPIEADPRDAGLADVAARSGADVKKAEGKDAGHAGNGIYIGDAYRAWAPGRNGYFRLSAGNPDLAGNVGIALMVMEHHSAVDLKEQPIVLQADYPKYADESRTVEARRNINAELEKLLKDPAFAERQKNGGLYVVKTETDAETWKGRML